MSMPVRIRVEHVGDGWIELFKGLQPTVDEAGRRIASEACGGYGMGRSGEPPFKYYPKTGNFTAMGFVTSTGPTGAYYQQRDKALSRAVHG